MSVAIRLIGWSFTVVVLSGHAETLTIFSWESYLAPDVIAQFEKENNVQVKLLSFNSDDGRNQLLWSGYPRYIDIVLMDSLSLRDKSWYGLFQKLPEVLRHQNQSIDARFTDRCGELGVPYMWGGIGIAYRSTQVKLPITKWSQIFEPEAGLKGRIAMMDDAFDNVSVALKSVGYSINSENEDELRAAYRQLLFQRDYVALYALSFDAIADPQVGAQIAVTMTYSGDFYVIQERSPYKDWVYVTPEEGTALWMDCLSVLKSSEHQIMAERFLQFINRPEIAVRNGKAMGFTPVLRPEYLPAAITDNKVSYPPSAQLKRSEFYSANLAHDQSRMAIYYAIKK